MPLISNILAGKIIVITGGCGLIGKSFAEAVLRHGGKVVIADINSEEGDRLKNLLSEKYSSESVCFFRHDVLSEESTAGLIRQTSEIYNKIDGFVNAVYVKSNTWGKIAFEDTTIKDFCENINFLLGGVFITSKLYAEFFRKQGWGNIINLSSIYGVIPPRFEIYNETKMGNPIEYGVAKSGIIQMTKYLAKYYKGSNIRFNCISPGGILNEQNEDFLKSYNFYGLTKGMLDAADLNGALVFLLSDLSAFINGQNLIIDDGWTL